MLKSETSTTAIERTKQSPGCTPVEVRALVMGMGIRMFGKERRMIQSLSRMQCIKPLFMLSSWDPGPVSAKLEEVGIPYRKATFGYLGFGHPWWTLKNVLFMPALNWKVLRAYRQHRASVLVFAEVLSFLNALPAFLWLRLMRRPRYIFYLGDIGGGTRAQRLVGRLADRFADCVIVNSRAVRDGLQSTGWQRAPIHVVYNGVDFARFHRAERAELSEFSDWPSNSILFGFVGQLTRNKGIEDFLLAARLVLPKIPQARFLVLGDCPQKSPFPDELRQRFADLEQNVQWLGFVPDIERYYAAMHTIVVPSRHTDPAPNVILEAMASGLPVIATSTGGSVELIEDEVTGFLVAPQQPQQIAQRMIDLADNIELVRSMGEAGCQLCQSKFDLSVSARMVESLIIGQKKG